MKKLLPLSRATIIFCLISVTNVVNAHHGGGFFLDRDQLIGPVTGTATRLAFVFPHVAIYFDKADEDGNVENYVMSIRWTPTVLRDLGWNRRTIVSGDELTVTYIPDKRDMTVGSLMTIEVNGEALPMDPER